MQTSIPEWGDPSQYPASPFDGFVSYHPPGSEGWPYPNLAYLRPWPPPGATTSTGLYDHAAWPLTNGVYGSCSKSNHIIRHPRHHQPVFHMSGASRPGSIMGPSNLQKVPRHLAVPSIISEYICPS